MFAIKNSAYFISFYFIYKDFIQEGCFSIYIHIYINTYIYIYIYIFTMYVKITAFQNSL